MNQPSNKKRELLRIVSAARHSWHGLRYAYAESAFRQEYLLFFISNIIALCLPLAFLEYLLLLITGAFVLIVEIINSAVEAAIDRVSLEQHSLSKRAKDLGSAAVMCTLGLWIITWLLILGKLIFH